MSSLSVPQPNSVSLRRLFPQASFVESTDIVVADVTARSDDCQPGTLFAALPGTRVNGADFVADAIEHGAVAILAETPLSDIESPQCIVPDARAAYATLCQAINRWPARQLTVAGVTGTNGKSTVTWLLRAILRAADRTTGLVGTIETDDGRMTSPASLTTPDSLTLAEDMARMVDNDCSHAVLELSSHALHQSRAAGVSLAVAAVTNITHDHLDYHGDFDAYCRSKARIAELCGDDVPLLINADDEGCEILAGQLDSAVPIRRFGIHCTAEVRAQILTSDPRGSRFEIKTEHARFEASTSLPGEHNVANCLAAAAVALELGIDSQSIVAGLAAVKFVPGRLQRIRLGQPFQVYVDYAHTPDALERVIRTVRPFTDGKTICVIGAGGNRDAEKRPLLGRAAAGSDVVVVTSDNPRDEDPAEIIDQIVDGLEAGARLIIEPDRGAAITQAIGMAEAGDSVLIAGKGHETTQTIGDCSLDFDDCVIARCAIAERMSASTWQHLRKGA